MRVIKHALLSLIRKPTKAIMVCTILVLVFGLIFTGVIIQNSVEGSKKYVRRQLGATVQFTPNYLLADKDKIEDYSILQPTEDLARSVSNDYRVKDVYLVKNGYVQINGLSTGRKMDPEQEKHFNEHPEERMVHSDIFGVDKSKPIEFEVGGLKLEKGEFFTPQQMDNAEMVALISDSLARVNNLEVGAKIKAFKEGAYYKATESGGTEPNRNDYLEEITIVGIYSGTTPEQSDRIYMPLKSMAPFSYDYDNAPTINGAYILLNDPLDVESYIADSTPKLPNKYMKMTANDDEYKRLTAPLNLMATITTLLIWVVFGAGALIIISIVTIFVRDRKFEIGLLLASGESKVKILLQFMLELFVIALLAFLISAGASQFSSKYVGEWISDNQLVASEEQEIMEHYSMYQYDYTKGSIKMENVAEEFGVSISFSVLLRLLLLSFGLLFFAVSIPLIIILSYNPREALQD